MPHVGLEPTALTHAAQTVTQLTKWTTGFADREMFNFPTRLRQREFPFVCKSVGKSGPPILQTQWSTAGREIFDPKNEKVRKWKD